MAGVANLYTVEFFQDLKRLLKPHGIAGQWIHGYNLWPQDLQMIVRTFRHVFPHTTIWNPSGHDFLLMGHADPFVFHAEEIERRLEKMPAVKADLATVSVRSSLGLLSFFVLNSDDAGTLAQEGPLNTDDLPLLEFSAPKALYANTAEVNDKLLNASRRKRFPHLDGVPPSRLEETDLLYEWSLIAMVKGNLTESFEYLNRILAKDPRHTGAYLHRGQIFVTQKQLVRALEDFRKSISIDPEFALAHYQLGLLYLRQKLPGKAVPSLERAVKIEPDNPRYLLVLGDAYRQQKRFSEAAQSYQSSLKKKPRDVYTLDVLAFCFLKMGQMEQALHFYRQALSVNPANLQVRRHLVRAYEKAGKLDVALNELKRMIRANPADASAFVEMGRIYLLSKDQSKARQAYQKALKISPQNFLALQGLQKLEWWRPTRQRTIDRARKGSPRGMRTFEKT
jgi:tetratricopeptide (TPR) repeat protein